ncbi:Molybdenum ABC transporter, substrate-binding protein ModA [hydrothermal vent metagenome]|uniref:Molybdenum ABC transporter, substrate-binding protein ModA n=1 Tax=hydrothermal vent metagenome TaxID=652676 RepID=A0A3B1BNK5_9ZZZZ
MLIMQTFGYTKTIRVLLLVAFTVVGVSSYAVAGEVNVAVAANFLGTAKKISSAFEQKTGHKIILSAGSTGQLYAQIRNGAPYDFFFSADSKRTAKLEKDGFVANGARFIYALGGVALYSAEPEYVDGKGEILRTGNFNKLAIANPKTAPYGRAAIEILDKMGLYAQLSDKLVYGQSVAQAFQFVASKAVKLGFVALSQLKEAGTNLKGSYWAVNPSLYEPIKQEAALLRKGESNKTAMEFMEFTKSAEAKKIIKTFGYTLP